jgi:hypothetical protein
VNARMPSGPGALEKNPSLCVRYFTLRVRSPRHPSPGKARKGRMRSAVIIVVSSFLIATGVGVWAASMTHHRAVGVRATLAEGAPLFRP